MSCAQKGNKMILTPEEQAALDAKTAADKLEADKAALEEQARLDALKTPKERDEDMVAKLVKEKLDAELAPIKGKLDAAFTARDEALRKVKEYEAKEKEENLKRLTEEGKHKEVYDLKLAELNAEKDVMAKRVTELTRDVTVRDVLKSYSFRNDNAADVGYREVISQLVQNDKGDWVHRSGVSIKDFVTSFASDENNSYLFKAKVNSGNGGNEQREPNKNNSKKSLYHMTQAEVLALAEAGKL